MGGYTPSPGAYSCVEIWDGIASSQNTALLRDTAAAASANNGTIYSGLYFGSHSPYTGTTQEYNCGPDQLLGAGLQNFVATVTFETE